MNYSSNFHETSAVECISFVCDDPKEEDDKRRPKYDKKRKHGTKAEAEDSLDDWTSGRAEKGAWTFYN